MATVKDFCLSIMEAAEQILEQDEKTPLNADLIAMLRKVDSAIWSLNDEINYILVYVPTVEAAK